jgi:hypothetical protein
MNNDDLLELIKMLDEKGYDVNQFAQVANAADVTKIGFSLMVFKKEGTVA